MLTSVLEHLFCLPNICIAAHPCIYLCLAVKDFIFSKSSLFMQNFIYITYNSSFFTHGQFQGVHCVMSIYKKLIFDVKHFYLGIVVAIRICN